MNKFIAGAVCMLFCTMPVMADCWKLAGKPKKAPYTIVYENVYGYENEYGISEAPRLDVTMVAQMVRPQLEGK